jgi:hypothetical protein
MSIYYKARDLVRHVVLDGIVMKYEMTGEFESIKDQPVVQFMLLHDVYPNEEKRFTELLEWLSERFKFVSYSEAVAAVNSGQIVEPMINFSFDDGMQNNYVAAKIMRDFEAKGCFFVCPNIVNESSAEEVAGFCRRQLHRDPCEFLSWEKLAEMKSWGHEIGSHTLNHTNLKSVSLSQAEDEIYRSRDLIVEALGKVQHFAWPYGRYFHLSDEIAKMVFDAGYASCASGERGSHVAHDGADGRRICIHRESMKLHWPLRHIKYFVAKSANLKLEPKSTWPNDWQVD